jgi:hypothetical protein
MRPCFKPLVKEAFKFEFKRILGKPSIRHAQVFRPKRPRRGAWDGKLVCGTRRACRSRLNSPLDFVGAKAPCANVNGFDIAIVFDYLDLLHIGFPLPIRAPGHLAARNAYPMSCKHSFIAYITLSQPQNLPLSLISLASPPMPLEGAWPRSLKNKNSH